MASQEEQAAKPLAHALDATLSMLLDDRIAQFRGLFEEIDERFEEHHRLIESQQDQINNLREQLGLSAVTADGKTDGSGSDDESDDGRPRRGVTADDVQKMREDDAQEREKMRDDFQRDIARERGSTLNEVEKRVTTLEDRVDDLEHSVSSSTRLFFL